MFLPYVAGKLPADEDPLAVLGALHTTDLYLACACARRHPNALALFQRDFLLPAVRSLARKDALPGASDDFKQVLNEKLLVGEGDAIPRIGNYSGRGPLAAWLGIASLRIARALRAVEQRNARPDDAYALSLPTTASDPELLLLKTQCSREFRDAFVAALSELSPRETSLIKLHFLEGVTADALAAMYGVSKRTIFRSIDKTRRQILEAVRGHLARHLNLRAAELQA